MTINHSGHPNNNQLKFRGSILSCLDFISKMMICPTCITKSAILTDINSLSLIISSTTLADESSMNNLILVEFVLDQHWL